MRGTLRGITVALTLAGLLSGCPGEDELDYAGGAGAPERREPAGADERRAPQGAELYAAACASCHGPDGQGVPGRGTDLSQSQLVATGPVDEMVEFLRRGHPVDTTIATSLNDAHFRAIAEYVKVQAGTR